MRLEREAILDNLAHKVNRGLQDLTVSLELRDSQVSRVGRDLPGLRVLRV